MGIGGSVAADGDGYPGILGYQGPALSAVTEARIVPVGDEIERMMVRKSETEIALIRESARWCEHGHRLLQEYSRPGATEAEASWRAGHEATLAMLEIDYDWDFGRGEARMRAAIAASPGLAEPHISFSAYLAAMGRSSEAIAEARRGLELDPLSEPAAQTLGYRFYYARDDDSAIAQFGRTLERNPNAFVARTGLAHAARARRQRLGAFTVAFFVAYSVGLLLVAGEEVAWGQWFFHWKTPEAWSAVNVQHETTLHNVPGLDENLPGPKTAIYSQRSQDGKVILREAMARYVPADVAGGVKQGFSAPDATWFRGESIDYVRRVLMDRKARIYDYLDFDVASRLVADHIEGRENRRLLIWSLIVGLPLALLVGLPLRVLWRHRWRRRPTP